MTGFLTGPARIDDQAHRAASKAQEFADRAVEAANRGDYEHAKALAAVAEGQAAAARMWLDFNWR